MSRKTPLKMAWKRFNGDFKAGLKVIFLICGVAILMDFIKIITLLNPTIGFFCRISVFISLGASSYRIAESIARSYNEK